MASAGCSGSPNVLSAAVLEDLLALQTAGIPVVWPQDLAPAGKPAMRAGVLPGLPHAEVAAGRPARITSCAGVRWGGGRAAALGSLAAAAGQQRLDVLAAPEQGQLISQSVTCGSSGPEGPKRTGMGILDSAASAPRIRVCSKHGNGKAWNILDFCEECDAVALEAARD